MEQSTAMDYFWAIIAIAALTIGLISMAVGRAVVWWDALTFWWDERRYGVMSRAAAQSIDQESNEEPAFSSATTTPQNSNNALQSGATSSNELLRGQARVLAAMVKADKVGETEGLKIAFGVSPSSTNPRYIAARAALKLELARLESPAEYRQDDGTTAPASRPVTGQR